MNRATVLLSSLIICAVSTSVSAHEPKPEPYSFILVGENDVLQLAFFADCTVQQRTDDYSVVSAEQRSIRFSLVIEGSSAGGSTGEYIDVIEMVDGAAYIVDVPAGIGQLLRLSVKDVSGQGVCQVMTAGRTKDSSGNTRANLRLDSGFVVNHHTYPY